MMIRSLVIVFISVASLWALERVPKQYALESGFRYTHKNDLAPGHEMASSVQLDYSWQLSGLDGTRNASFISVPFGATFYPSQGDAKGMYLIQYGWTVRHSFLKTKSIRPFVGYGLLLNQAFLKGRSGSLMGHQTRFDVGAEFLSDRALRPYVKAEWSMTRFKQLDKGSSRVNSADIKVGIRFYKKKREKK